MYTILLIGIGGFIGAVLRYSLSGWVQNSFVNFPLGTLVVNIVGSFFLGLVMYLSEYQGLFSEETRILLTIGLLGAFTTLSTFSYKSFRLLESSKLMQLTMNIVATVLFSIFAVYLGKVSALNLAAYLRWIK